MSVDARTGDNRDAWRAKPALRLVYHDLYRRMAARLVPGRTLEVGGGGGNLKEFAPDVISTDISPAPWLDAVCDAQDLPFAVASFANIVLFDVLHHMARPDAFFTAAGRVLVPGGRIVMVEPAITPVSRIVYGLFHPEPVDMSADPLAPGPLASGGDPWDANQAIPTLLFRRKARAFRDAFPDFDVLAVERLSLFVYPLTGGYSGPALVPAGLVPALLRIEDALCPLLGPLMAFRLLVVLQRD